MRVPNQPVETILQKNLESLHTAAKNGEKLDIGKLTNGLSITKDGALTAGPQKILEKISSFCERLFSKLGAHLHSKHLTSTNERAQAKTSTFLSKLASPYQQKLQSKILETISESPELSQAFHAILDIQNYHPQSATEDLNRLKSGTNFNQSTFSSRTADQSKAVTDMQKILKRAVVEWLLLGNGTNNDSIASVLSRTGHSGPLDLPTLAAQLPNLYPSATNQQIATLQNKLMATWMKLEVGHEWGIALKFFSDARRYNSEGSNTIITTGKAALLVSDFMKAGGADALLKPESQEKVKQAALAGSSSANTTNANCTKNGGKLIGRKANRSTGEQLLRNLNKNGIVTIPTGWASHTVGITLHKATDGKFFLYYSNRGANAFEKAEDRALMGYQNAGSCNMVCFEIGDPSVLTPELLGQIAGAMRYHSDETKHDAFAKPFIEGKDGIYKLLKLKKVIEIPKTAQKMGNCSWANCKGSIHAALIAAAYDESCKPGQPVEKTLEIAIQTGTQAFKSMERFGRGEGLKPLLAYNALEKGAPISAFDHLRSLSAAAKKLDRKVLETWNTDATINEDRKMRTQIADYFKTCPYPISDLNHTLLPAAKAKVLSDIKKSGNGSYAFINDECHAVIKGQLINLGKIDLTQTLGTFISANSELTQPIFLPQSSVNALQDTLVAIGQNLQTFLHLHEETKTWGDKSNLKKELLKNPDSKQAENSKIGYFNTEFKKNLAIQFPGVDKELQATITEMSIKFSKIKIEIENKIADQRAILENNQSSMSDKILARIKIEKQKLALKNVQKKYNDQSSNFKNTLMSKSKLPEKETIQLFSIFEKTGLLVSLYELNRLRKEHFTHFQTFLDDAFELFTPPKKTPPLHNPIQTTAP